MIIYYVEPATIYIIVRQAALTPRINDDQGLGIFVGLSFCVCLSYHAKLLQLCVLISGKFKLISISKNLHGSGEAIGILESY